MCIIARGLRVRGDLPPEDLNEKHFSFDEYWNCKGIFACISQLSSLSTPARLRMDLNGRGEQLFSRRRSGLSWKPELFPWHYCSNSKNGISGTLRSVAYGSATADDYILRLLL